MEQKTTADQRLRRAQSLVGSSDGRPDHDFYETPPEATRALLAAESFEGDIWEPACGKGAIARVLEEAGKTVRATDLIYRGYGEEAPLDFLWATDSATNIITNPPFNIAEQFATKALRLTTGKVALLCKLQWLEGAKRRKLFESTPLARVHVFSKRLSMYRHGEKGDYASGMIAFCWLVWEHGYVGAPTLHWL